MNRGQAFSVFQLLIGAVVAVAFFAIVWGVIQYTQQVTPGSDPFRVSCELVQSAFAAAGTGQGFTRYAQLKESDLTSQALAGCAGLPEGTRLLLYCDQDFCEHDGRSVKETGECATLGQGCTSMAFRQGENLDICAKCSGFSDCLVWFGEKQC
jgi:hypothetical protein